MGDFNIDLLKYEKDHKTAHFLEQIYSNKYLIVTSPTRITSLSGTLIGSIFSTEILENKISGNIVTSIYDELTQFLIRQIDQFKRNHNNDIYQRNFKHLEQQIFLEDIQNLNWNIVLNLDKKDISDSLNKFF